MEIQLPGYQINEKIYEGPRTLVYRAIRLSDDQKVVIKLMRNEYPSMSELVQFRNQYAISKNLDLPGIVKSLSLDKYGNGYALVMEDTGGISLDQLGSKNELLDLENSLKIAIQLGEILHELYQNRIIHKDFKPANILINPDTKEVKLIDFSIASLLPREAQEIQNPNQLEGTLAYISPEQTGRMNRGIDYRSDFYSLGVTLYEVLAGKLPFTSDDSMELVHSHLSKEPPPLGNREKAIPAVLSALVLKLMAKNAEERYQSAFGLKFDLEKCLSMWQETGSIEPFELGERDLSERFLIPEKLYGRETEVQTLLDAFSRVAAGTTEMMLVAGFSGIGKTAVVSEVHKPIVRQRGYFIKGKFDQFQRNIPFSALVRAFRDLMGQLLGESDSQLERWKTRIINALGESSQVIIEVIPELEDIIGQQPPAPELSGSAAQNRFNRLFQQFIRVFTTAEHPLTIFVDDLQWADSASLKLMELQMEDTSGGYLLLLGAYRDNEVFPAHPLMLTLDEIAKSGATLNTITLAPLSQRELNRLVADTLSCSLELALPLTELVYEKTKGNPFFATQFLNGLHEDGWIEFNADLGYWECDMTSVRELALSDDVVEFMATRLHKLPEATRELLKLAACIGDRFDLETLAIVSEQSPEEIARDLWLALKEGLILPLNETYKFYQQEDINSQFPIPNSQFPSYKFLHDRVQQAAYSLIPEAEKQATHYRIGKRLLSNLSPAEREERIFALVNQINIGQTFIEDVVEKKQLIELNLSAGQKAKAATACEAAKTYFKVAIGLLENNPWTTAYNLAFQLHLALAEVQLMSADFESLSQTIATLLEGANSPIDRAQIYVIKVNQYALQGLYTDAIKAGLEGLLGLDITVNRDTLKELIREEFVAIENKLENRSIASLLDLPPAKAPEQKVTIELLMNLLPPAYIISDLDLYSFTIARNVSLSIEGGNIPKSITGYVNYGFLLGLTQHRYQRGLEFADLALQLSYKLNSQSERSSACFLLGGWIHVWAKPIKGAAEIGREGFLAGMESGELQYAGYNLFANIYNRLFQGENLAAIAADLDKYSAIAEKIKNDLASSVLAACRYFLNKLFLSIDDENRSSLSAEEQAWIERYQASQSYLPLGIYYILQIHEAYLSQSFDRGIRYATEARNFLMACAGSTTSIGYYYYTSLNLCARYLSMSEVERQEALQQIETNQGQLKIWSENCQENFLHKYLLVEAERSRIEEKRFEALELYDKAIAGAKENEYIQEEALANELAAKFYLDWGKEKVAAGYMQEAYYCYARWGATAKVEDLEKRYRGLLKPILERQILGLTPTATIASLTSGTISKTTTGTGQILDLATLMKAAQTLSEDIELKGAIANLMQVARENAGAQTVALMLFQEEVLMLTALLAGVDAPNINPIPVEASNAVPLSIVNQVKRRREALVLDNASKESALAVDAYIQSEQPKSILCLPLIARGQLIGILYLENNRVAGAFTRDRLEVLNLLCSQAAISLENARLYEQSTDYADKLERSFKELQAAQLQLIQSEKMSALGNLVAGVAHEINNPVGFIAGNLEPTLDYIQELFGLIELYQQKMPSPDAEIEAEIERMDLEFVRDDLFQIISAMQEGTERLAHISTSLRTFSRTDKEHKVPFQLQDGIESTLLILKHRLKANKERPEIEIEKNYEKLPPVNCYPGQLNQVFMNLLANAIDALEEGSGGRSFEEIKANPHRISLKTSLEGDRAVVKIADNGVGMSEAVKQRIFEHGFTTKGVGKGTGLGMAIALQIIREKHGGTLTCTSEVGRGTEFCIALPLG